MSDPWAGILDPDEQILWQGRPRARLKLEWDSPMSAVMAVFFTGFSIFWMAIASVGGGVFWMFGLPFFGVGFHMLVGVHFWEAFLRARSHYTLTSRRAFIATDLPVAGRSLKSYPINDDTPIELQEGDLSNIYFAERGERTKNGTNTIKIGFEELANGREVLALIRQVQRGET